MIFPTNETIQIDGISVAARSTERSGQRWILPAPVSVTPGDILVTADGKRLEIIGVRAIGGFGDAKVEVDCRAWS
jgi:hypothetical protein